MKKIVPDTSILVKGMLSGMIEKGELDGSLIIIPKAALDELQSQASRSRDIGFQGLEEIKKIRALAPGKNVSVEFSGDRPTMEDIQLAKKGRIDAIIRDAAAKEGATLMTADYVQALVAEAEGVGVKYLPQEVSEHVDLEKFFDSNTQSVHLKVGIAPLAKKGKPGAVVLHPIRKEIMSEGELKALINEVVSKARKDDDSFIEMGHAGSAALVVQMGDYRISITRPPFSSALELTAVRPIAKVTLEDYELHESLKERFKQKSQGILIAGPPGAGKSSFASALAEFIVKQGKIVKTFEQPRDLQVGPEVTQYAPLEGSWEKAAELLLLVRPDYTIFDEIRKTRDFHIFGDMRLAGVGMIGVIHATNPVAAIQRFVGRLELGVIPHVVNTVIYIDGGKVVKVYEVTFTVRVPSGMKDADLARPVVEVKDFATKTLEYEIYTYGEENVVVPVEATGKKASPIHQLAIERVLQEMRKYDPNAKVEVIGSDRVSVAGSNGVIARVIGKQGSNIEALEERLGIRISVEPVEGTLKPGVAFRVHETGGFLNLLLDKNMRGRDIDVYDGDEYLMSAKVGKGSVVSVKKKSELGHKVLRAVASGKIRLAA